MRSALAPPTGARRSAAVSAAASAGSTARREVPSRPTPSARPNPTTDGSRVDHFYPTGRGRIRAGWFALSLIGLVAGLLMTRSVANAGAAGAAPPDAGATNPVSDARVAAQTIGFLASSAAAALHGQHLTLDS